MFSIRVGWSTLTVDLDDKHLAGKEHITNILGRICMSTKAGLLMKEEKWVFRFQITHF